MNDLEKIIRFLLLFAVMVLPAGVARGQEKAEDFKEFVERFVSDCEFQRSRVLFPVEAKRTPSGWLSLTKKIGESVCLFLII